MASLLMFVDYCANLWNIPGHGYALPVYEFPDSLIEDVGK